MAPRALLAAAAVLLLAGLPTQAISAVRKQPTHQDPTELWNAYPLGEQPQPKANPPKANPPKANPPKANPPKSAVPGRVPAPVPAPPRSSTPSSQPSPTGSFPLAAVVSIAMGAAALALLAVVVLRRRRRGPGGSLAVLVEPLTPSGDPFSIVKVWPRDIEGSFSRRVQRAIEARPRDEQPLSGEGRKQFLAAVASSGVRWNTLGRQVFPPRRDSVSDGSQEQAVALEPQEEAVTLAPAVQANDEVNTSAVDQTTAVRGRADIGERINEIIRTAEAAAQQVRAEAESEAAVIRARAEANAREHQKQAQEQAKRLREEAEAYAAETQQTVDSYATQKRRQAEAEAGQLHREAELQARAIREAAEEMAKQLEAEARRKQSELHDSTRAIEAHLDRLLQGIKETGSQLEALVRKSRSGESLTGALSIRQRLPAGDRET
jgi:hypothetical protein